jgi:uncharacterized protein
MKRPAGTTTHSSTIGPVRSPQGAIGMKPLHFIRMVLIISALCVYGAAAPVDSIKKIIDHAKWQTTVTKDYDPAYVGLAYPMGDVPITTGVCTDVIVRAFRSVGIDLQRQVHEDMLKHFSEYPRTWGLKRPDANIDHRRVSNLTTLFKKLGKEVPVSQNGSDYLPGDIVTWVIGKDTDHIGMVSDEKVEGVDRYYVIHNIGEGTVSDDVLFQLPITGHYRYFGPQGSTNVSSRVEKRIPGKERPKQR